MRKQHTSRAGSQKELVTLLRSGNRIVVDPTTSKIRSLVEPQLTYTTKEFFHGYALRKRKQARLPPFEETTWQCHGDDHKGRLATSYGFAPRLRTLLGDAGYEVRTQWATAAEKVKDDQRKQTVYKPQWDRIAAYEKDGYEFRYMQREVLELIAAKPNGRIGCPPGWG